MKRMIKLTIAYDGTSYSGWQKQIKEKTIEGELIKACKKIFRNDFIIRGASRTDAGVHALGQVASLEIESDLVIRKIRPAINSYLPNDIVIQNAEEVDLNFHPRFDAKEKTYCYQIYNSRVPLPQYNRFSYFYYKELDIEKMKIASKYFLGEHDFIAFSSAGGNVKTTVRTIYECEINNTGKLINIIIIGNSFLYNMVRIIAGTLIDVGLGKLKPEEIPEIINSKDRERTGKKSPPKGLTLIEIKY